ncbi:hypothetical protein [Burkholderia cenocepacia]|uniref:hypothetical protein n=1 Tax=Burkholderia cenocepacia TaxID=95486 RepID=UPI001907CFB0|nr:hypothetical protein [Burkholderia cenocepacia]MBJ9898002.1 hypothetical protein [Burkholderia cenocepacia]MBJ9917006.1 hypothetical protein [Burkholderia cenocepacia]MBR8120160.1 hypothetical protein [Burkholderia cenocepacia]MBR8370686.1 hypothetical protein [Burkholderia cenocepacia]MBR8439995.1 hypothetical protein [Burkholderia cenocepacia]
MTVAKRSAPQRQMTIARQGLGMTVRRCGATRRLMREIPAVAAAVRRMGRMPARHDAIRSPSAHPRRFAAGITA